MFLLIFIILLLVLMLAPQFWARHVLKRYSVDRPDMPGTGGELVEHLRKKFALEDQLQLESTAQGDHYDPADRTVRLTEANLKGRSLTAVAVAAHEFGHALQHARGYKPLLLRTRMVIMARGLEKVGTVALIAIPLLTVSPLGSRLIVPLMVLFVFSLAASALVHLVTLPVELDASFGRALPILKQGQYISPADYIGARRILTACALTYLAGSLAGLLNFWRWFRFLRR